MRLPLKALHYGQLKETSAGQAVPTSGHEVKRVEFIDADGEIKTGYYKPLAPDYPTILAKYSVTGSIAMRISLGDKAAEERLVFDITGKKIIGTVSVAVPNYEPLNRYVSVEELLHENCAQLLIPPWYRKCDDRHPGNFSIAGLIDWDMMFYHITHIMKGGRYIDGILKPIPKKAMELRTKHLDNFPNVEGRTHWPANTIPGNYNYYKSYAAAKTFQYLAANPVFESESFQEQMFSALLKELLTFDPEVIYQRLYDSFGELPLDYQSLEKEKAEELEKQYPKWFNDKSNTQSFVNHMMQVLQGEYDELYNIAVHYLGCETNNFSVPVTSFSGFLRNKPSSFHEIIDWIGRQNDQMSKNWEKNQEMIFSTQEGIEKPIPGTYFIAPQGRFDPEKMKQRYHKLWRDSHVSILGAILNEAKLLANQLADLLRDSPVSLAKSMLFLPKEVNTITEAWMLLGEPEEINESQATDCQPNNELRQAFIILEKFIGDLHQCADLYYKLKQEQLTSESNNTFIFDVEKILQEGESKLYKVLGKNEMSIWARDFTKIANALQQLTSGLNFERHLRSKDNPINSQTSSQDFVAPYKRRHSDKEVVESCLKELFDWAELLEPEILDDYILTVISDLYEARSYNLMANRSRAPQVKEYLKSAIETSGANRLATILSIGGCKNNSLNTYLIATFIPQMLHDTKQVDLNLLSVRSACMCGQLDSLHYSESAQEFVLNNERFKHMHAKINIELFNETMYQWITNLSQVQFKRLIEEALQRYEPYTFNLFSGKKRGPKVRGYFNDKEGLNNEKILASIFAEGGLEANSLNPLLFEKILKKMKKDFLSKNDVMDAKTKIVLQAKISSVPPCPFLSSLEPYAKLRILEKKLPKVKPQESNIMSLEC